MVAPLSISAIGDFDSPKVLLGAGARDRDDVGRLGHEFHPSAHLRNTSSPFVLFNDIGLCFSLAAAK